MLGFLLSRLAHAAVVLGIVTVLCFAAVHLIPGDQLLAALSAGGHVSESSEIDAVRESFGLQGSVPAQFVQWITGFVQGDWGRSIGTGQPVRELFAQRLPVTLELFVGSTLWTLVLGLPVGMVAALRRGSVLDTVLSGSAMVGIAIPAYWLAIVMIYALAVELQWLPPSGYVPFTEDPAGNLRAMLLPTFVAGVHTAGLLARYVRSSLLDALQQDHIRTARARGLSERQVLVRHALRPAMIPLVTVIGLSFGGMVAGSFFIEQVFALPGLGRMTLEAILGKDFPVIQAALVLVSVNMLAVNLLVDLLYAALDPRVRVAGR
ncbi:ABC transporter permease [Aquabacterium sp. A7-Y]|uniref:ABC transporter permease n=1 Tax=Aquabacterium sp. A7-Y TaxID=1349605 RepID=UPI00223DB5C4|nr:ABC transporter permease [Aquabacterium sp. A7-Y]MCW7536959.1 ABC transporter permease [Aquabacterium sp. A7-Y]